MRKLVIGTMLAVGAFVGAASGAPTAAHANETTYYSTLHAGTCTTSDRAYVGASVVKRRGAYLDDLTNAEIQAGAGSWLYGGYYNDAGQTNSTTFSGSGYGSHGFGANNDHLDPYIKNLNSGSTLGAGCFGY